jgi:hypothetical protein
MFFPSVQDVLFADFTKMSLTQDSHDFAVQAINKLFSKSDKTVATVTIDSSVPTVDSKFIIVLSMLWK